VSTSTTINCGYGNCHAPWAIARWADGAVVFAASPKERLLAVGTAKGISLWDLTSGVQVAFLDVGYSYVLFEPSGALLAGFKGELHRLPIERDLSEAGLLRLGPPQKLPLPGTAIATSQDGRVLVCAGHQPTGWRGQVWHRNLPGPLLLLAHHEDARYIDVSPDGQWVATGSHWGTKVKISAARTGELVHELPVEEGSRVHFSPDSRWLATTGGGCRLWVVGSWREGPHLGGGESLAFSPDGNILAVETGHGTVRLVNPDTGREYARLEDPNQARAHRMCFTPDGTQLIMTSIDSDSIQVWDLRIIRKQLDEINLDWDLPAYPPAAATGNAKPLRVRVDLGNTPVLADFNKLIELYPKLAWSWSQRAAYYAGLKDWDNAIADNTTVIELDPKNEGALRQRALFYTYRKQWDLAIADYAKIIELDPQNPAMNHFLAWLLSTAPDARVRDPQRAIPLAKKAVELAPNSGIYWTTLGVAHYRAGDWKAALAALEKSLQLYGKNALPGFFLAMCHEKLGDKDKARQCYEQAARWMDKSQPKNEELGRFRAEAAEVLGVDKKKE
jgi:Tfp pilus assembly protein PilF